LLLTATLFGCTTAPAKNDIPAEGNEQVPVELLRQWLPGSYSNFAQVHDSGRDSPVNDVRIRRVKATGETVFLLESEPRHAAEATYDIYWLKSDPRTLQAELHFTRLGQNELSLPTQEVIKAAWQRVHPGCTIIMKLVGDRITGQSNPETCVFQHALQGETRLARRIAIDLENDSLTVQNRIETASGQVAGDNELLQLQKHRVFTGWASVRVEAVEAEQRPGAWQLSTVFDIRDDGRIYQLRAQDRALLGFGVQLSRLERVAGEKPYTLLTVINLQSGAPQAYSWFRPSSENLNMNLDWFQANLELRRPGED
jgi:hypothetical protein